MCGQKHGGCWFTRNKECTKWESKVKSREKILSSYVSVEQWD